MFNDVVYVKGQNGVIRRVKMLNKDVANFIYFFTGISTFKELYEDFKMYSYDDSDNGVFFYNRVYDSAYVFYNHLFAFHIYVKINSETGVVFIDNIQVVKIR